MFPHTFPYELVNYLQTVFAYARGRLTTALVPHVGWLGVWNSVRDSRHSCVGA